MRTKYEQNKFAVYKGKIYSAYTKNGFIRLRTYDTKEVESGEFESYKSNYSDVKGIKEVSPYEVTEYYEQTFEAKYKGKIVGIMRGDDDQVDIQPEPADFTYEDLINFGFKQVEKGVYEKNLPTSELMDLHAIKEDFLEYAKQDFDENNKS